MLTPDWIEYANVLLRNRANDNLTYDGNKVLNYQTAQRNHWYIKDNLSFFYIDSNGFVLYPFSSGDNTTLLKLIKDVSHLYSTEDSNKNYARKFYPENNYIRKSNNKEFYEIIFLNNIVNAERQKKWDDDIPF